MHIYNTVEFVRHRGEVFVDGELHTLVRGKHSMWIPELNMKFPFHWNGHFVEYKDVEKGQHWKNIINYKFGGKNTVRESLFNVVEEMEIFTILNSKGFSPKVGDMFYIKNLITDFLYDYVHCDAMGAFGFYIDDATTYKSKEFNKKLFIKEFIDSGILKCSETALSDLCLDTRDNIINGYIIDIRRSIQDAIHLNINIDKLHEKVDDILDSIKIDSEQLKHKIFEFTQFPYKKRSEQYQSYYIGNELVEGSRDINYRFNKLQVPVNLTKKSVLDLGCNLGGVAQECYHRGASKIVGIDYNEDYIECARDLARFNGEQINFLQMDLTKTGLIENFINGYFKGKVDIVFCLAIDKHIGLDRVFQILDSFKPQTIYWEGSAAQNENTGHVIRTNEELKKRYDTKCLGYTEDRNKRYIWKAVKK